MRSLAFIREGCLLRLQGVPDSYNIVGRMESKAAVNFFEEGFPSRSLPISLHSRQDRSMSFSCLS
jgi:hypothetical protein